MPYFKIKPSAAVVAYFPLLLKHEYWYGTRDANGAVTLMDVAGSEPLPAGYLNLVIAPGDVEDEVPMLPKKE
ncbi:hypothetical protein [Ralstonia phage phiRSL1]|uniref:Uncharacterized protein n=1 Tax=Ralstonia phage phiRSL1 TaxID=1980924 RepID=B2ZY08_9CAUD|nr:hypothetical protein RSL1_ORF148 [Ralstonia phage phiRSL1]BAG41594.1 hypothetical protein [Ralstonia phage phiRSL1]